MNKTDLGAHLRKARNHLQWSQTTLAETVGIPRSRLSHLETGRRSPSAAEWRSLGQVLNLGPYPALELAQLPPADPFWHVPEPRREPPERPARSRLYAARKALGARSVDGALAQLRTRPDQETCQEFLEQARTESGLEYFFWLQLLASGALPCRLSLYKAGFRALRVVEAGSRKGLGDSRAACLDVQTGRCRCLLFPQVTLDTRKAYFRLDALACVRARRDRCWLNLEIDGEGHDGQFDQERQLLLGLPTIRLSASEVASPNLLSLLDGKLAHVVGLPRAS